MSRLLGKKDDDDDPNPIKYCTNCGVPMHYTVKTCTNCGKGGQ